MGKIFIKFADSTNTTQHLILRWAELATPTAYLGSQSYAPPHPQRGLTIDNLRPVMHRLEVWRSSDGLAFESWQLNVDVDASLSNVETIIYDYVVGRGDGSAVVGSIWRDPYDGEFSVSDERLRGLSFYVEQRGVGKLRDDEHVKDEIAGTWALESNVFSQGDTYFAVIQQGRSVDTTTQSATPDYLEEVTLNTTTTFSKTTHGRKLLSCAYTTTIGLLVFPAFSTIGQTKVRIVVHEGTQRYVKLQFADGNKVWLQGKQRSEIYLGMGEEIELLFNGAACRVIHDGTGYARLGEPFWARKTELNSLTCDGTAYLVAEYPRFYYEYIEDLPAAAIKTFSEWDQFIIVDGEQIFYNRGFFAFDVATARFRVPDDRGRIYVPLDGTGAASRLGGENPGSFQMDAVGKHNHGISLSRDTGGADAFGFRTLPSVRTVEDCTTGRNTNVIHNTSTDGTQTLMRNHGLTRKIRI